MSDKPQPWCDAVGSNPGFFLVVGRTARAPLPWTWEIRPEGDTAACQRSARGYRSAEEAWAAGRAALADVRPMDRIAHGRSDALTAEQRSEIAKKAAAKRWDRSKKGPH